MFIGHCPKLNARDWMVFIDFSANTCWSHHLFVYFFCWESEQFLLKILTILMKFVFFFIKRGCQAFQKSTNVTYEQVNVKFLTIKSQQKSYLNIRMSAAHRSLIQSRWRCFSVWIPFKMEHKVANNLVMFLTIF